MPSEAYKHILLATDGSDHALAALDVACDLASQHKSALSIVHVVEPGPLPKPYREFLQSEHLMRKRSEPTPLGIARIPTWFQEAVASAELSADEAAAKDAISAQIVHYGVHRAKARGVDSVTALERHGPPADEILQASLDIGADVIIMGTRGVGKVAQLITGGVSSGVAHSASCRCILVK